MGDKEGKETFHCQKKLRKNQRSKNDLKLFLQCRMLMQDDSLVFGCITPEQRAPRKAPSKAPSKAQSLYTICGVGLTAAFILVPEPCAKLVSAWVSA